MKALGQNLYHIELPYSDYPEGFKELVKDEKEWQKWVSDGPNSVEAYNYIDGTSVIGLMSDMKFHDETFEFVYQDMLANPEMMERMKFHARAVVATKTPEETPKMCQLFCFDSTPSEWPDPVRTLLLNNIIDMRRS
ncbi:hypothetical protein D3C87_1146850 [compost metagenome]